MVYCKYIDSASLGSEDILETAIRLDYTIFRVYLAGVRLLHPGFNDGIVKYSGLFFFGFHSIFDKSWMCIVVGGRMFR